MNWSILPKKSNDLIEQLLLNRDFTSQKQKEDFFNPKLENFKKILDIPQIDKALVRIQKAIANQELIIAYGDYDVDGIAGAAVLYLGLTAAGAKVLPYIPHREKEGYGLSIQGLDFARDSGATLVITCDTGIVAFEMCEYATKLGLDLIITDHHQLLENKKPDCLAVIHSTALCGTAVAWCLIKELISTEKARELLDFVAVATIADMMSLLGVNRSLVKEGLKVLNKTTRVGWQALFTQAGIEKGQIGSYEIGHIIAPRLNAMGRLEHAIDSLRLLCTKDLSKAQRLADLIAATNDQRKQLTTQAVDEAKLMINGSSKKIHILASESWIPGIIGLVAGRVCEETGSSAIAISVGSEHSKGSARASGGVNIVELIRGCSDILVAVGGHKGAAGFTIETSKIDEFKLRLEQMMDEGLIVDADNPILDIEAEVLSSNLDLKLVKEIDQFEPFGIDNPRPILATLGMRISQVKTVGSGKHLKFKADNIEAIAFGMGQLAEMLEEGQLINLAYNLEIDRYNGLEKLQLKVKDIQLV